MAIGKFRGYMWDPVLIISQIIAVQSLFYAGIGLWQFVVNQMTQRPLSVQQLFEINETDFVSKVGRIQLSVFLLNSLTCSVAMWWIVQRAKQCLDFSFTVHFFHFVFTCIMIGFPTHWVWWVKTIISVTITSFLSEYLCMKYELMDIPVNNSAVS